jgi:hypothetical protein
MTHQRIIAISAESLLGLIAHYDEGKIPTDAEIVEAGVSETLQGWVGLKVRSKGWSGPLVESGEGMPPLHFRYEGRKTMSWDNRKKEDAPIWSDAPEAPKRK